MTMDAQLEIKLSAYADGELDAADAAEVEALLARDAEAARIVFAHREMSALLRAACDERHYAPTRPMALRAVPPARGRQRYWAAAAAIALMLGFSGGALWRDLSDDPRMAALSEVAEYHTVFSRETDRLVEIPAERTAELRAWLGARIGRDPAPPDMSAHGLRFAGGRMLVVDGRPVAELMYVRDGAPPLALCVSRAAEAGNPTAPRIDAAHGMTLASWRDATHDFVWVGEIDAQALRGLAEAARRAYSG